MKVVQGRGRRRRHKLLRMMSERRKRDRAKAQEKTDKYKQTDEQGSNK